MSIPGGWPTMDIANEGFTFDPAKVTVPPLILVAKFGSFQYQKKIIDNPV